MSTTNLDCFYIFGDVYETLDTCQELEQLLGRLRRQNLLNEQDWSHSKRSIVEIRSQFERRILAASYLVRADLQGRVALVTGSGRGIGRSTALALARAGARTLVTARTASEIDAVARTIGSQGGEAASIVADISRDEDMRRLFEETGPIDILINNAGIIEPIAPTLTADPSAWQRNIAINLNAVFLACHYALPSMLERGWGRIVNVSSGAARGTTMGWGAYSAAKAGVEAFTGVLSREVADAGVRVNAVRPGIVDTEMQVTIRGSTEEEFGPANVERFRSYKEQGRLRHPDDPARLILWLLSREADGVTGEVLAIDDPDVAARIGLQPMGR
jgi:NAD(P)-dependent dehydrogenase (short-subunit alcohol dehydrogenase family)